MSKRRGYKMRKGEREGDEGRRKNKNNKSAREGETGGRKGSVMGAMGGGKVQRIISKRRGY
jgi:hypothetical protein